MMNPAELASKEALAKIQECIDGNQCFRLEAGAGAGKTYSLIESIKHIINDQGNTLLNNRQQIACITYTNIAKDQIRERTDNHPVIFADTIHAFCWGLLQHFQAKLREHLPGLSEKWQERINGSAGINNQTVKYDLGFASITDDEVMLDHDDVIALMAVMLSYPKFQSILKNKFPVIFVDEYQDTNKELAASLVTNLIDNSSGVLVGLFGDHWQKIYGKDACGLIESKKNKIIEIGKKANFRSDNNIVSCLNNMRSDLPQASSRPESQGVIKVYHSNSWTGSRQTGAHWKDDLPEEVASQFIDKVKSLMHDDGWDMQPEKTKILFTTNKLIAKEQGFINLANAFRYPDDYLKKNDKYIKFFLEVLEPMVQAFENKNYGELFKVLAANKVSLNSQADKTEWLAKLECIYKAKEKATVKEMLLLLESTNLPKLSSSIVESERKYNTLLQKPTLDADEQKFIDKLEKLHVVEYQEVSNLGNYINENTPFSTQHGVKGAEFDNVLVILGRGWSQYNWNDMLEWWSDSYPSDKQETFERNRNLFYVSCSRAKHNLTLLFTQKLTSSAIAQLEQMFGKENLFDALL